MEDFGLGRETAVWIDRSRHCLEEEDMVVTFLTLSLRSLSIHGIFVLRFVLTVCIIG